MDEAMERFWQDRLKAARGVLPPKQAREIADRAEHKTQNWYDASRRGREANALRNCEMFLAAGQASIQDTCQYVILTGSHSKVKTTK